MKKYIPWMNTCVVSEKHKVLEALVGFVEKIVLSLIMLIFMHWLNNARLQEGTIKCKTFKIFVISLRIQLFCFQDHFRILN